MYAKKFIIFLNYGIILLQGSLDNSWSHPDSQLENIDTEILRRVEEMTKLMNERSFASHYILIFNSNFKMIIYFWQIWVMKLIFVKSNFYVLHIYFKTNQFYKGAHFISTKYLYTSHHFKVLLNTVAYCWCSYQNKTILKVLNWNYSPKWHDAVKWESGTTDLSH